MMNYYISGSDDIINVATQQDQFGQGVSALAVGSDKSKWYFVAPSMFSGNWGISYGGKLEFNIASFAGDFSKLNDPKVSTFAVFYTFTT